MSSLTSINLVKIIESRVQIVAARLLRVTIVTCVDCRRRFPNYVCIKLHTFCTVNHLSQAVSVERCGGHAFDETSSDQSHALCVAERRSRISTDLMFCKLRCHTARSAQQAFGKPLKRHSYVPKVNDGL